MVSVCLQSLDVDFIVNSFERCGLGKRKDETKLNSKLLDVMNDRSIYRSGDNVEEDRSIEENADKETEEENGLHTDEESNPEEVYETIDFNTNDEQ